MLTFIKNRAKEGSSLVGVIGLIATAVASQVTTLGTTHSALGYIAAGASVLLTILPQYKGFISTTETLLTELEPVVVQAWPYIQKAITDYKADKQAMVPTVTGR